MPISAQIKPEKWGMVLESQTDNDLHLKINIPASCIIGKWKLFLETKEAGQAQWLRRDAEPIFILFNPWCKGIHFFIIYAKATKNEDYRLCVGP